MPQTLFVELDKTPGGEKQTRAVSVIRSWQAADGSTIMLFSNGSYGYRNGEPVRSAEEFEIIVTPVQIKAALAWWARAGKELSEAYYAAKARREAELAGDFQSMIDSGESDLDAALYTRISVIDPGQVSGPFSWMDLFQRRPDWWGQAMQIRFGDYEYQRAEASAAATPAMDDEKSAKFEIKGAKNKK